MAKENSQNPAQSDNRGESNEADMNDPDFLAHLALLLLREAQPSPSPSPPQPNSSRHAEIDATVDESVDTNVLDDHHLSNEADRSGSSIWIDDSTADTIPRTGSVPRSHEEAQTLSAQLPPQQDSSVHGDAGADIDDSPDGSIHHGSDKVDEAPTVFDEPSKSRKGKVLTAEQKEKNKARGRKEVPFKTAQKSTIVEWRRFINNRLPGSAQISDNHISKPTSVQAEVDLNKTVAQLLERVAGSLVAASFSFNDATLDKWMENIRNKPPVRDLESNDALAKYRKGKENEANSSPAQKHNQKNGKSGRIEQDDQSTHDSKGDVTMSHPDENAEGNPTASLKRKASSTKSDDEGPSKKRPFPKIFLRFRPSQGRGVALPTATSSAAAAAIAVAARDLHNYATNHIGVNLQVEHFLSANRNPIASEVEENVSTSSLDQWVTYEMQNITADQLNEASWRCLLRALEAYYRSQQGDADRQIMFRFLNFMGVPQLDLTARCEDDIKWIVQALAAKARGN